MRMINNARDIHDLRIPPSNRLALNIGVPARRINEIVLEKRKITADALGERLEKEVRIYSQVA